MKKILLTITSGTLLGLLPGCFKKPYDAYKTTYKTEGAQQYADKTIEPQQATKKNIKYMTLPEARAARIYFEERNEVELIEKVLTHIIKLSDNYQEKADCVYEFATIQLSLGRLEKARELFEQLIREYPGVSFKKEAEYRRILAHYWDCNDAEHDQELTEKTLRLAQEFIQEWGYQAEYQESLECIQDFCYKVLFEADFNRMNFYLSKYRIFNEVDSLGGAQLRLAYILGKLLEPNKQLSSQAKDSLIELYAQIQAIDSEKPLEKYDLLMKTAEILAGGIE